MVPIDPIEVTVCNVLCDILGLTGFINLIEAEDPDPIWICMELDGTCPINDNANATITELTVTPPSGPVNTQFNVTIIWNVGPTANNTIATGEVEFVVVPPSQSGMPFGDAGLIVEEGPGNYEGIFSFTATPGEDESFAPGVYNIQAAICEGSCGAVGIHDHCKVLSLKNTQFHITG